MKYVKILAPTLLLITIAILTSSSLLEIVAGFTGLWCVWLVARESIWNFPIGIVNIAGFFWEFYQAKLYADMALQVFFFILTIWGWVVWLTGRGTAKVRPTTRIRLFEAVILLLIIVIATIVWGIWVQKLGDPVPYLDAFLAVVSIVAQYLLSKKVLENWLLWILVDILSIGMYAVKSLYVTAGLYFVFLLIATAGWFSWRKGYQVDRRPMNQALPNTTTGTSLMDEK